MSVGAGIAGFDLPLARDRIRDAQQWYIPDPQIEMR